MNFFLETTALRDKVLGHSLSKAQLTRVVGGSRCVSSRFVQGEITAGFIRNIVQLYFRIEAEGSVEDGLKLWSNEFGDRKPKDALIFMAEAKNGLDTDHAIALGQLRELIRRLLVQFRHSVPELAKTCLKCSLGKVPLDVGSAYSARDLEQFLSRITACQKSEITPRRCGASGFIDKNGQKLQTIRNCSDPAHGSNRQFQEQREKIGEATKNPEWSCAKCRRIADTIIALDFPADCTLLTTDTSFDALCPILGKKHKRLLSVAALRKVETETSSDGSAPREGSEKRPPSSV